MINIFINLGVAIYIHLIITNQLYSNYNKRLNIQIIPFSVGNVKSQLKFK